MILVLRLQAPINSLDFSADGLQMISSSDDDSIIMYDCISGQKSRSVISFVIVKLCSYV